MLDINMVRENPELVKASEKKRNRDPALVDEVLSIDAEWRKSLRKVEDLKHQRNVVSEEINTAKKAKNNSLAEEKIKKMRSVVDDIKRLEQEVEQLLTARNEKLALLGNILQKEVPVGKDAQDNKVIKKWGKITKSTFELQNHAELLEKLGYADFDAGISNAGQGFNYLKGDTALLDLALQRYGVDFLLKNGFAPVTPPLMLNYKTLLGALNGLKDFQDVVYKIENEDLYLIGTAEHSLVASLKNKIISEKELPIKLFAVTPCFRKEIGGHGIDMKWLYRMHQFNKVEQVVFSAPEQSGKMLKYMQGLTEKFFQSLGIPYRVLEICSGDLGLKFARQWDIEAWFPRQKEYREVTSAGTCTDFQANALNIKYVKDGEKKSVHILNNTMVATSRAMVAILENFQTKKGTVKIPKVLWPYMNGVREMGKK